MTDAVQISAQAVNELRSRTGAGLMACKNALVEAAGNAEKAIDILRAKGEASAAKKADRDAKEGLVASYVTADGKAGALVQVSCETDFVAKTPDFASFVKGIAQHVVENHPESVEALNAQVYKPTGATIKDSLTTMVAKLGEHMQVKAYALSKGDLIEQYIHLGGKVGVLLHLTTNIAQKPEVKALARDICMHIAASAPLSVGREEIPADVVAKEKEIAAEQAKGKPAAAIEKIIAGKLEKFYAQSCLLEQPFVKNPDVTVRVLVDQTAKQAGGTVTVVSFKRFQVGA
jgi:elongation factor Ts